MPQGNILISPADAVGLKAARPAAWHDSHESTHVTCFVGRPNRSKGVGYGQDNPWSVAFH